MPTDRELDQLIDAALPSYSAAEPRPGLEQRILTQCARESPSPKPSSPGHGRSPYQQPLACWPFCSSLGGTILIGARSKPRQRPLRLPPRQVPGKRRRRIPSHRHGNGLSHTSCQPSRRPLAKRYPRKRYFLRLRLSPPKSGRRLRWSATRPRCLGKSIRRGSKSVQFTSPNCKSNRSPIRTICLALSPQNHPPKPNNPKEKSCTNPSSSFCFSCWPE